MKLVAALLFSLLLLFTSIPVKAAVPDPPDITGEAAYLIDVQTGQALYKKNADITLAPASTTKIMTALLAIEKGNLDDTVTATNTLLDHDLVYGTQIYLIPGEKMSLRDLLYAVLLNSANDAAITVAEHIGGSVEGFVTLMNNKAQEIGALNTHFKNPSGLSEQGHVTTAHDLAIIAKAAYQNPVFAQFVKTKKHIISREQKDNVPVEMFNENKLLGIDSSVDGIKTGYTSEAENCLVTSATRNGRQLIGVILKSPGREIYNDMENLLDYGFKEFKNINYKNKGDQISTILVSNQKIGLILNGPIIITTRTGKLPLIRLNVIPPTSELKTFTKGQQIAQVEAWDDNTLIGTYPLIASDSVVLKDPNRSSDQNYWAFIIVILIFTLMKVFPKRSISIQKKE